MADQQKQDPSTKKAVPLETLAEGQEISGSIFPIDPSKGISTVRVSATVNRAVKFNPAAEGTIMCGW